jgi:type IV secretion system protein VirB6
MACPSIITGDQFLSRTIAHIDCQAQLIGSYGYLALGQPGSGVSLLVTGLLTIFIAFFGIRLLFGPIPTGRDVVFDVLKIGIVLTLAFSWPAFRTLVYDTAFKGPAEIASVIQESSGNGSGAGFVQRLQAADNAMVDLTIVGSGRNAAALIEGEGAGSSFRAAAIQDDTGFGSARLLYLAGVIGTLGLLRIGAGILLALAPIAAGLYFFPQSRGIFAGWLKGLVFTLAGSVAVTLVLAVQLAVLEPWLADALRVRGLGYATPAAPTELFAIALAFLIVQLAMLWLFAKVAFYRGWLDLPAIPDFAPLTGSPPPAGQPVQTPREIRIVQSERISHSVENTLRRERALVTGERLSVGAGQTASNSTGPVIEGSYQSATPRLGNSYRRTSYRASQAARRRDSQP